MRQALGYVRASHPLPTLAVTSVITAFGWSLGWRGVPLALLLLAVLLGQLSVGWSNDAHDAGLDARAGRGAKPTVAGAVSARGLWAAAIVAVGAASALSWMIAGPIGGTFHVVSLAAAWAYNVRLSRTAWSWLPYAVAFGCVPPFLSIGIGAGAPPPWSVAVFAIVGVSAHLANALPDVEIDREAGMGGLVVRLGVRRAGALCWGLLGLGTVILAVVTLPGSPVVALVVCAVFVAALAFGTRSTRPQAAFRSLLVVTAIDVFALIAAASAGG